jgi:formate hydrogenlyase transcriptional activator
VTTRAGPIGPLKMASSSGRAMTASDLELLAHAAPEIAIAATNAVALDDLSERNEQLLNEKSYLEQEARERDKFGDIIGGSAALRQALSAIESVAATDATVLILGETGTGKELAARAIHRMSPRCERPFVRVNAAAIPSGLLESELFGHEKGAFTGAVASRAGRLELAEHGTIFLDEVGDLPLELQPKLLRVLQEREYERLGSNRTRKADVRLIAATNRDLEGMVAAGEFREDLYYRLSVFPIRLPALRERAQDIPALVRYFAEHCAKRLNRKPSEIPQDVMQALTQWQWPGNVRELENVIERAVIISQDGRLRLSSHDLQIGSRRHKPKASQTLKDVERNRIIAALRESSGVIAGPNGAASRLGVKRTTLQSMMRRLGIQRPSF